MMEVEVVINQLKPLKKRNSLRRQISIQVLDEVKINKNSTGSKEDINSNNDTNAFRNDIKAIPSRFDQSPKLNQRSKNASQKMIQNHNLFNSFDSHKIHTMNQHYYPEGGFGFFIVLFACLLNFITLGPQLNFNIIFSKLKKNFFSELQYIELIGIFNKISGKLLSPLITALIFKFKTLRLFAIIGCMLSGLSILFSSFSFKYHQFLISFSILNGLSCEIIIVCSMLIITQYFKRKLIIMELFILFSNGLSFLIYSFFVNFIFNKYSWRKSLQIISSLGFFSLIFALLLRPASIYHPQRRAILHLKNQKQKFKQKFSNKTTTYKLSDHFKQQSIELEKLNESNKNIYSKETMKKFKKKIFFFKQFKRLFSLSIFEKISKTIIDYKESCKNFISKLKKSESINSYSKLLNSRDLKIIIFISFFNSSIQDFSLNNYLDNKLSKINLTNQTEINSKMEDDEINVNIYFGIIYCLSLLISFYLYIKLYITSNNLLKISTTLSIISIIFIHISALNKSNVFKLEKSKKIVLIIYNYFQTELIYSIQLLLIERFSNKKFCKAFSLQRFAIGLGQSFFIFFHFIFKYFLNHFLNLFRNNLFKNELDLIKNDCNLFYLILSKLILCLITIFLIFKLKNRSENYLKNKQWNLRKELIKYNKTRNEKKLRKKMKMKLKNEYKNEDKKLIIKNFENFLKSKSKILLSDLNTKNNYLIDCILCAKCFIVHLDSNKNLIQLCSIEKTIKK